MTKEQWRVLAGRKGGQKSSPLKGFGTNRELAKKMGQLRANNIKKGKK